MRNPLDTGISSQATVGKLVKNIPDSATTTTTTTTLSYLTNLLTFTLPKTTYKILKTSVLVTSACAILALLGIYRFQSKIIYPASLNDGHGKVDTPDEYGMEYEPLDLKTSDGEVIKAYSILHDQTSPDYTNKTILILCPNAGNMGHFLPIAQFIYRSLNYNVFIYSYRGYGNSSGTPSEKGLKLDADTVMDYISKDKQLSSSSMICYGRSLGGANAIYIASNYPNLINGLILENTFLNIPNVIPHIFPFLSPFKKLCHQIWNSERDITMIPSGIPALFLSGLSDEIVPPSHMKKLFELSNSSAKQWVEFEGAHHNDTIVKPGYWEAFHRFCVQQVYPVGK